MADWQKNLLDEVSKRPSGLTEVRRDGKDDHAIQEVLRKELQQLVNENIGESEATKHMRIFARAAWASMEALHLLFLDDEKPENERMRLDPDHWYENNTTNASLFANLSLEGLPQLCPGRLFTTRMPRNIVEDPREKNDWLEKVKKNNLKVICVLTEPEEFKKYSGMDNLKEFYRKECGLVVYNRAIPDFQIPTSGDLVNNILDLTYHLSQGENCLIHCAGGTGRTGMVLAAIFKNLGVYDPIPRIRKVKSTYVETYEQELFLKNMPSSIDPRIVKKSPLLAKAIAAEHLLEVFLTHGNVSVKPSDDLVEQLEDKEENKLHKAYCMTFDLVDTDKSGTLDKKELLTWMSMCGAELDLTKVTDVLLKEGKLTRQKFAELMSEQVTSNRRGYDISGNIGGHH